MANFRAAVDKAVFDALNVESMLTLSLDDGAIIGGVFNKKARDNTKPPFVVFQFVSNIPYYTFGRRFGFGLYLVKGVSESPWPKEASDIDTQIDTLLQDTALTIAGFDQIQCRRESEFDVEEEDGSIIWQHIGGIYRIEAGES